MSAFTAVNGGPPKETEPPVKVSERPFSSGERAQAASKTGRHGSPEAKPTRHDAWQRPTTDHQPFPPVHYSEGEGSHKRKRSSSVELKQDSTAQERTPDWTPGGPRIDTRDAYSTSQREYRHYGEDEREKETSWRGHQSSREERNSYDPQQNSATSPRGQPEEQIGDALRRATGQMDHSNYGNNSPDAEDQQSAVYGSVYGIEHRSDSVIQHDPQKRKRNFSNRTRTGCLTCRKRKKKCNEQKPECSNCIRGGFLCAGYPPQRGAGWPKQDVKPTAVYIESKDPSYVPPGAYGMPQHGAYGPPPVKREPLPRYRGQMLRIDPPHGRPLVVTDDGCMEVLPDGK